MCSNRSSFAELMAHKEILNPLVIVSNKLIEQQNSLQSTFVEYQGSYGLLKTGISVKSLFSTDKVKSLLRQE